MCVCAGSSSESSSSSPKYHPNNRRGIGDGSSRQGSLTPANFESSLTSVVGDKEMLKGLQMKYEEESTIRLLELIRLNLNHILPYCLSIFLFVCQTSVIRAKLNICALLSKVPYKMNAVDFLN